MKKHIVEVIKQIEKDHDIKVLYACESGSRAWGFPSKDSDYDVRFIYVHKVNWYLSIDQKRDVIEIPGRDSLSIKVDPLLDVSGWELTKALRLFRKSNPPLLEWLRSSMIYYQAYSTIDQLRAIENEVFSPISCMHHYLHMAKRNFREYLQKEEVKIKKYFYVLRPVLAGKWIENHQTVPPIEFEKVFEAMIEEGPLKQSIHELLARKKAGEELFLEKRIDVINEYLEKEIDYLEQYVKTIEIERKDPTDQLDQLFRDTLKEVWS
ncbi:nucleotidyltransferase domain-containing protein [Bacillus carboniphilus]|uniref:Nucleotidyltransferase domain-containing protein n=1 Tax=Bacillus carboniphilus TaxID=86663 RepID=A0ABY9JUG9_9BACI|nr:nucleotidyltransferase domain-containing protein [Bacillus carboniphilus]WLR42383.1 nucleotidyltransferase domain-containing protein [Bacillus carboniphilus]